MESKNKTQMAFFSEGVKLRIGSLKKTENKKNLVIVKKKYMESYIISSRWFTRLYGPRLL